MATNTEIKFLQNTAYYDLLQVQAEAKKAGIELKSLKDLINRTKSAMTKEDIAWVEQQNAEN